MTRRRRLRFSAKLDRQVSVTRDPFVDQGGPSILADLKQLPLDRGYEEGSIAPPGDFVLNAFVAT